MTAEEKRKTLVRFLDQKVFDPVLQTPAKRYASEADRRKLEHVKKATEGDRVRYYEHYRTPGDVRSNFVSDLSSRTAERIHRELRELGLPSLADVKDEFLDLCDKLDVTAPPTGWRR